MPFDSPFILGILPFCRGRQALHCVYESVVPRNYRVQKASVLVQAGTPARDTYLASPRAEVVFILLSVFCYLFFEHHSALAKLYVYFCFIDETEA